ncbi:hypothetical protein LCGC14_1557770, partial [marine sediment metagenome]
GTVSPLYEYLGEHIRSVWVRAVTLRIDDGTYDEERAIPTVVDRLTKELQDETME